MLNPIKYNEFKQYSPKGKVVKRDNTIVVAINRTRRLNQGDFILLSLYVSSFIKYMYIF
jgi:hypothetical protein